MSYLFDSSRAEQDARDCLLKYYNSQAVAHGSYLLSIAIGFFAFVQAVPYIPDLPSSFFSFFENSFKDVVSFLILSTFTTFSLYLFIRTIYWGVLSGYALHVRPISEEEACRRDCSANNLAFRLNISAVDCFKTNHPDLNIFVGASAGQLFKLRFVIIDAIIVISLLLIF